MERELSAAESAIVSWMIEYAPMRGSLGHLAPTVEQLRVVENCKCGCPGIDFKKDGQASPWRPIGDARGVSPDGVIVGVILWGSDKEITGLEVYSETGKTTFSIPAVEKMKTWDQPDEA
jgi:hypothetical protein